ncbi:MAG: hypothetical protein EOP84_18190 [Verrucomicrobiaceae bacterium]|nr:MAG: hypothetical protein EOP84_18190 [Verrucomicrobiaceae bacterium]
MNNGKSLSDKKWRRFVTAGMLALGLLMYCAVRAGWLDGRMADFSAGYLIFILLIVIIRAVLTELGVRRPRYSFRGRIW